MDISVAEAAATLGVSPRRVQGLLADGRLAGRRIGRTWLVDERGLVRVARRSRPLGAPLGSALLALLSGVGCPADDRLRGRLAQVIRELLADADPASRLASWLPVPPHELRSFAVPRADLLDLRADVRVVPTGVSDLRSGLVTADQLEARIWSDDLPALVHDHVLSDRAEPNVRLHLDPARSSGQVPFGRFLVDLSAHPGPREAAAVRRLLHGLPQLRQSVEA